MAKKVIDIIPPRDRAAGVKASVAPAEDTELTGINFSASEPLSRLEPESALERAEFKSEPVPEPLVSVEPGLQPLKPQIPPRAKPRVTFMGRPDGLSLEEDDEDSFGVKIKGWLVKLLLVCAVIAAVMFAVDWKMAYAVVKIWPATSELNDATRAVIDPSAQAVNTEKGIIPGLVLSAEDTIGGQAEVTGKKDTQGKSTGAVKIFNNYTAQQRLVKGTRLQAPAEKFQPSLASDETPWFRTTEDVVLEPKTSATVTVIADGSGEKYNIEPSVFSVPGLAGTAQYTFVYAQSYEKFQGGSTGSAPSVTQVDLDNAKTMIDQLAKDEMEKKLLAQLPEGYVLVAESQEYEFGDPDIQAKVGDSLGRIDCSMDGKATAVAYKKSDLDNLGKDFILKKVPQGSVAYQPRLEISGAYEGPDPATQNSIIEVSARVLVYPGMEDNEIKKGLSEKSANEAKMFLEDQGMKVQIKFAPFWRTFIPRDLDRIEVQTIIE